MQNLMSYYEIYYRPFNVNVNMQCVKMVRYNRRKVYAIMFFEGERF